MDGEKTMIFPLNIMGLSSFMISSSSSDIAYDTVLLSDGAEYESVIILDKAMTLEEMESYFEVGKSYGWDEDTIMCANFQKDDLDGGNTSVPNISHFELFRQNVETEEKIQIRDDIPADAISTFDCTNIREEKYIYQLVAVSEDYSASSSISSNEVESDYYGWFISDFDKGLFFKFDIGVETSSFKTSIKKGVYDPLLANYFITRTTATKKERGRISCELGYIDENNKYIDTREYYDSLVDMLIGDGKKYIKNRKKDIWQMEVNSDLDYNFADFYQEQPIKISFSFVQTGEL